LGITADITHVATVFNLSTCAKDVEKMQDAISAHLIQILNTIA
jgi:hypothetical protein